MNVLCPTLLRLPAAQMKAVQIGGNDSTCLPAGFCQCSFRDLLYIKKACIRAPCGHEAHLVCCQQKVSHLERIGLVYGAQSKGKHASGAPGVIVQGRAHARAHKRAEGGRGGSPPQTAHRCHCWHAQNLLQVPDHVRIHEHFKQCWQKGLSSWHSQGDKGMLDAVAKLSRVPYAVMRTSKHTNDAQDGVRTCRTGICLSGTGPFAGLFGLCWATMLAAR